MSMELSRCAYPLAAAKEEGSRIQIRVGKACFGDGSLPVIAGPCSVESREQIIAAALAVRDAGAVLLRGGAFKPRSSPYAFQGLGKEGLELLSLAKETSGLPTVSEIMDAADLPCYEDVDILQVGARNMQNYALLKALGRQNKPVLLKRGPAASYEEWLMSAEYILAGGNGQVILCERGLRSFETYLRNLPDLAAIPALHQLSCLPVIFDPSHSVGLASLVPALAAAAVTAGADGLMLEVHPDPNTAKSDPDQALTFSAFAQLAPRLQSLREFWG